MIYYYWIEMSDNGTSVSACIYPPGKTGGYEQKPYNFVPERQPEADKKKRFETGEMYYEENFDSHFCCADGTVCLRSNFCAGRSDAG